MNDIVEIFISSTVFDEINYDEIEYNSDSDVEEIIESIFNHILHTNQSSKSLFKLVGILVVISFEKNPGLFQDFGFFVDEDALYDIKDKLYHSEQIQKLLYTHYLILKNRN